MNKIDLDNRKYLTPREVEEIFGIKSATLRRKRWGDYGMPYHKHKITSLELSKSRKIMSPLNL